MFGQQAFIHVIANTWRKLDYWTLEGFVIAQLDDSKGWLFVLKESRRLVSSALVFWPEKPPARVEHKDEGQRTPLNSPPGMCKSNSGGGESQCISTHWDAVIDSVNGTVKKSDVKYIINRIELGQFADEKKFTDQELLVDKILVECTFFAASTPKSFRQAAKSSDWLKWKAAIDEELRNLDAMKVWSVKIVPKGRKPLKGRWVFAEKTDEHGVVKLKSVSEDLLLSVERDE